MLLFAASGPLADCQLRGDPARKAAVRLEYVAKVLRHRIRRMTFPYRAHPRASVTAAYRAEVGTTT